MNDLSKSTEILNFLNEILKYQHVYPPTVLRENNLIQRSVSLNCRISRQHRKVVTMTSLKVVSKDNNSEHINR